MAESAVKPRKGVDDTLPHPREIAKIFALSVIKVLKVQCHLDATLVKVKIEGGTPELDGGLIAVTKMDDTRLRGAVALFLPKGSLDTLIRGMLGTEYEKEQDAGIKFKDAATEFLNIVYGNTVRILNPLGFAIEMTIPQIVQADQLEGEFYIPEAMAAVDFLIDGEPFQLRFGYESDPNAAST